MRFSNASRHNMESLASVGTCGGRAAEYGMVWKQSAYMLIGSQTVLDKHYDAGFGEAVYKRGEGFYRLMRFAAHQQIFNSTLKAFRGSCSDGYKPFTLNRQAACLLVASVGLLVQENDRFAPGLMQTRSPKSADAARAKNVPLWKISQDDVSDLLRSPRMLLFAAVKL